METYKFPVKEVTYQESYTIVKVSNNLAEINEKDPQAIALAGKYDGVKVEPEKKTVAKRGKE